MLLLASAERSGPPSPCPRMDDDAEGIRGPWTRPRMTKREREFGNGDASRSSSLAGRAFLCVRHGSSSYGPGLVTALLFFVGTGVSP